MNIAIDIDDTLTESFDYFQPFVAEYFGADVNELRERNISYSNLPEEWKKDELGFCKTYYDRVVADTPFKTDAVWGIQKLRELGHKIIIITGRTDAFYTDPYKTTMEELEKGGIVYDKLICTLDKASACIEENISILIDDLPANCAAAADIGISSILFESKANKEIKTSFPRVKNWKEVVEAVTKMNKIKIAFFDIDGTLIDMNKKKISEKTVYTLQKLKSNGIIICVATGRSPVSLPQFNGIEFDAYLTFNGSYCYNEKEKIHSNPISSEDVNILLKNASQMHRPVSVATSTRLAANGKDDDLVEYYSFAKLELEVAEDFDQVVNEEIYQVMLSCREEEYSQILKDTKNAKIAAWWDRAVDIIPANGGKGAGIRKILEYYHLEKEEAIAFGDGNNDIEMLEAVGTAVAMENASEKLKEIATDICGHVAEDGVYHYCLEHQLI